MTRAVVRSAGLLALLTSACAAQDDLHLVVGTVEFEATEVRAFTEAGSLSALSPVDANGGFTLAVGPATHRFYVLLPQAPGLVTLGAEAGMRVCTPDVTTELGLVRLEPLDCAASADPCTQAQRVADACLADRTQMCPELATAIEACHDQRQRACAPQLRAFDLCAMRGRPCMSEREQLDACLRQFDCGADEAAFFELCLNPCEPEKAAATAICTDLPPPEPCLPELVARPEVWPRTVGCP